MCAVANRYDVFDIEALRDSVLYAGDLEALCTALNRAEESTLRGDQRVEDILPLSSLPNYGPRPDDTAEIYSWDDTRILVWDGRWILVDREDR